MGKHIEETKLFLYGKFIGIGTIVTTFIIFIASLVLIVCSVFDITFLIIGIICLLFFLGMLCNLAFTQFFITISQKQISVTTLFGKKLKTKQLADLTKNQIKHLKGRQSGKYICLFFSEETNSSNLIRELLQEEEVILIAYTNDNSSCLNQILHKDDKTI